MRELLRAVMKTGAGSSASMILSAASSKIMAVVSGPFGIGLYSLIQQLTQTVSASGLAGGGRTVMAQGIASREGRERDDFIQTAFWLLVIGAILASLALILLAPWVALLVFNSDSGAMIGLVRWTALPVALTIFLVYLNGVLNGFMAIGRLAAIQVAGTAVNALISYPISNMANSGYPAAFVGMTTISLAVQLLIAYSKVHQKMHLRPIIANGLKFRIETKAARSFFLFAGTMMVGSVVASVSLLFIRSLIVQHGGIAEAGIFNVAWIICAVYPTVVLNSFATYYLPKLSQTKEVEKRSVLINDVFRLTMILIVPLELLVVVLKPLMIDVLYSNEFYPSIILLRWMIVGIYLKATAQVFVMPMLSSADMRTYFWTGNLLYVGFVISALVSLRYFEGLEVIGIGYVIVYAGYLVYALYYASSKHGYTTDRRFAVGWFVGLALIVIASLLTWNEDGVDLVVALVFAVCGLLYMAVSINKHERGAVKNLIMQTLSPNR